MAEVKKKNKWRPGPIVLEREMALSQAYLSLSGKAPQVWMIFMSKRQLKKVVLGSSKKYEWEVINNGDIIFTYEEGKSKWGINYQAFSKALDQLIEKGFLDIAVPGTGIAGASTRYSLSSRWEKYGTDGFVEGKRVRRSSYRFPKGHPKYETSEISNYENP